MSLSRDEAQGTHRQPCSYHQNVVQVRRESATAAIYTRHDCHDHVRNECNTVRWQLRPKPFRLNTSLRTYMPSLNELQGNQCLTNDGIKTHTSLSLIEACGTRRTDRCRRWTCSPTVPGGSRCASPPSTSEVRITTEEKVAHTNDVSDREKLHSQNPKCISFFMSSAGSAQYISNLGNVCQIVKTPYSR